MSLDGVEAFQFSFFLSFFPRTTIAPSCFVNHCLKPLCVQEKRGRRGGAEGEKRGETMVERKSRGENSLSNHFIFPLPGLTGARGKVKNGLCLYLHFHIYIFYI